MLGHVAVKVNERSSTLPLLSHRSIVKLPNGSPMSLNTGSLESISFAENSVEVACSCKATAQEVPIDPGPRSALRST